MWNSEKITELSLMMVRLVKVQFYLLKILQNWVKISERLEIALIRIRNQIWLIVILDGSWLLFCLLEHQCCCKVRVANWLPTFSCRTVRWNVRQNVRLILRSHSCLHVVFQQKSSVSKESKRSGSNKGHILHKSESWIPDYNFKMSSISKTCHQHIVPPTSVTSMDAADIFS